MIVTTGQTLNPFWFCQVNPKLQFFAEYSQDVLCLGSHAYLGLHIIPSFWGRLEHLLALHTSCLAWIFKRHWPCMFDFFVYFLNIFDILWLSDNSLYVRCPPASRKRRLPSSSDCPDCPSAASWRACDMQIWQVRKHVTRKIVRQVQTAEMSQDRTGQRVKVCQVSASIKWK